MRIQKICVKWVASGSLLALGINVGAVPSAVSSRAALGGNDSIDWSSQGPDGTGLTSPFAAVSHNGLGLTVSGDPGSLSGLQVSAQGGTFTGNFAPGDSLLYTGIAFDAQTLTIDFASPVFGAGAQIQTDELGVGFTAFLNYYDELGALIGSDTFTGNSTDAGDNSAIFVGVLDSVQSIKKIQFGIEIPPNSPFPVGSFAINRLDIKGTDVPETGDYLGLMFALSVFGLASLRTWKRSPFAA